MGYQVLSNSHAVQTRDFPCLIEGPYFLRIPIIFLKLAVAQHSSILPRNSKLLKHVESSLVFLILQRYTKYVDYANRLWVSNAWAEEFNVLLLYCTIKNFWKPCNISCSIPGCWIPWEPGKLLVCEFNEKIPFVESLVPHTRSHWDPESDALCAFY